MRSHSPSGATSTNNYNASRPSTSSSTSSPSSPPLLSKHNLETAAPRPRQRTRASCLCWLALITATVLSAMLVLRTLLAAAAAPCAVSAGCYHGFHSAFSFDAAASHQPSWMGGLRNDTLLTSLSVPGTHDTMTYAIGSDVLQCQNRNLTVQLAAGLRYFDIRARVRDDALHIYHGDGDTGFSYQDVLLELFAFLAQNPTEAIVMRLKQEGAPLGDHNTLTFEQAFNYAWHNSSITAKQAAQHMYAWDPAAPLPTLGDLRSKIFVLQNFPADSNGPANKYGIAWEGEQMVLEDLYIIPDVAHLKDKWAAIRDALTKAAADKQDNKALYLAHISASVGVLPIEAAAGPKNRTVAGMNDETGRWLEAGDQSGRTGVVIFDFPGKRGIDAVLARNAAYKA
ncbi:Phosphatidylinositol-specific phospholipase [Akanthomyces lecanii RCEF 1005]|uniref:Phosphatidylinositol-specific phospholipase n=1 Tax=Akanthomyces lecanii RCEF 1005 TaxID=1081108 RepID=A0A162IS67_CORDF|nr:Phosphatidylinositol-specific phospholipase [Akanthomyces lecanii RCEF 1005]